MKRLPAIIFFLIIGQSIFATDWFTYFIYVQKEYIQGAWIREDILERSTGYNYLEPKQFEELFNISGDGIDMANAILSHLKEENPERYKFKCDLSVSKDTIIIQTNDTITDFDAVKNELTASYIINSFTAVKIIQQNRIGVYLLKDITVPYMDLVLPNQASRRIQTDTNQGNTGEDSLTTQKTPPLTTGQPKNRVSIWLIISLVLNLLLIVWLIRNKK